MSLSSLVAGNHDRSVPRSERGDERVNGPGKDLGLITEKKKHGGGVWADRRQASAKRCTLTGGILIIQDQTLAPLAHRPGYEIRSMPEDEDDLCKGGGGSVPEHVREQRPVTNGQELFGPPQPRGSPRRQDDTRDGTFNLAQAPTSV